MPHPQVSAEEHRLQFVCAVLARTDTLTALCRRYGFSRRVGYKWLRRYQAEGRKGLQDRSPRPRQAGPGAVRERWTAALLALRRAHRGWGPKKLRQVLKQAHPRARVPSERTIARVLRAHGCIGPRVVRSRRGPEVPRPARRHARRAHDVWTIDFKGYFQTGDGQRCDPLTIRDLHSRYLLLIEHVPGQKERAVRAAMERCFRQHGLPRVLRVDNGSPFGNRGPRGLSRLSVWWWRLGIEVEFSRPGRPQDNGAHEQMHRVLKKETASPPAATLRAQLARFAKFRREYNEQRPHEALRLRTPASRYRHSPRPYRAPVPLRYAAGWTQRRVMIGGRLFWQGRVRVIGRAFQCEWVGLKPKEAAEAGRDPATWSVAEVYLGSLLLGELHAQDPGGLRAVQWRRPPHQPPEKKEG